MPAQHIKSVAGIFGAGEEGLQPEPALRVVIHEGTGDGADAGEGGCVGVADAGGADAGVCGGPVEDRVLLLRERGFSGKGKRSGEMKG